MQYGDLLLSVNGLSMRGKSVDELLTTLSQLPKKKRKEYIFGRPCASSRDSRCRTVVVQARPGEAIGLSVAHRRRRNGVWEDGGSHDDAEGGDSLLANGSQANGPQDNGSEDNSAVAVEVSVEAESWNDGDREEQSEPSVGLHTQQVRLSSCY